MSKIQQTFDCQSDQVRIFVPTSKSSTVYRVPKENWHRRLRFGVAFNFWKSSLLFRLYFGLNFFELLARLYNRMSGTHAAPRTPQKHATNYSVIPFRAAFCSVTRKVRFGKNSFVLEKAPFGSTKMAKYRVYTGSYTCDAWKPFRLVMEDLWFQLVAVAIHLILRDGNCRLFD
ncbi:unnamed protein product [Albugo candida]|uniref:Uncharacterized protein n=1 Tax=Albugo candida TaxID=65357 RepID=A0A024FWI0_9STRA|nr:unnamed protein product [Albugo candida]|eukprot:CCI10984.1 unnamed protein product [Albugo candida]